MNTRKRRSANRLDEVTSEDAEIVNSKKQRRLPAQTNGTVGPSKQDTPSTKLSKKALKRSASPEVEKNVSMETLPPRKPRGLISTPTKPRNNQHTTPSKPHSAISPTVQSRLTPKKKVNGSDMLTPAKTFARAIAEEIADNEDERIVTRGAQRRELDRELDETIDTSEEERASEDDEDGEEEDEVVVEREAQAEGEEGEEEEEEEEEEEKDEEEEGDAGADNDGEEEIRPVADNKEIAEKEDEEAEDENDGRMLTRGTLRRPLGSDVDDEGSESEDEEDSEEDDDGNADNDNEHVGKHGVKRVTSKSSAYEDFFERAARKKKSLTSNNTLSRLMPTLTAQESTSLLASIPDNHADQIKKLHDAHRQQFTQWKFEIDNGYNLLLFGYGSKRNLIEAFGREELADEMSVLVINGYFPNLSLDTILSQILSHFAPNIAVTGDKLNLLHQHLSDRLALLVHSLDSPILRLAKNQQILSSLASNKHITLVASVDHVNAPLLFDSLKASRYNFLWHDATTFVPLRTELSFDISTYLSGATSATASVGGLSGIKNVLNNLTSNSRTLYLLLLQHQLPLHSDSNDPGGHDQGITFPQLRSLCAKKILPLANPITLRGVLGEFFDHGLIARNDGKGNAQTKKERGGGEVLWAPFERVVISDVIEFLSS
jgi:origin recognition complex subunit 2